MTFFGSHLARLRELCDVLGMQDLWSSDPAEFARRALPLWLGGEHGTGNKQQPSATEAARGWPLLAAMGLVGRVPPAAEVYDEIVVMGAAGIGIHRRLELVRTSGVIAPALTVLAGLRPHSADRRDGGATELLATGGRFAPAPGWVAPASVTWRHALLAAADVDDLVAAQVLFPSESDLAELLLIKQWPTAVPHVVRLPDAPHRLENDLGQRPYLYRTYLDPGAGPETLRIVNGAPCERRLGPPRPTSASTFTEFHDVLLRDRHDLHLLVVVNQPHLHRVQIELRQLLADLGRDDISFDAAGCEVTSERDILLVLGEIPALISTELAHGVD